MVSRPWTTLHRPLQGPAPPHRAQGGSSHPLEAGPPWNPEPRTLPQEAAPGHRRSRVPPAHVRSPAQSSSCSCLSRALDTQVPGKSLSVRARRRYHGAQGSPRTLLGSPHCRLPELTFWGCHKTVNDGAQECRSQRGTAALSPRGPGTRSVGTELGRAEKRPCAHAFLQTGCTSCLRSITSHRLRPQPGAHGTLGSGAGDRHRCPKGSGLVAVTVSQE